MKVLLFLEYKFVIYKNKIYCEKVVDQNYMNRYLNVFDEVILCARESKNICCHNKNVLSNNKIKLISLPDFSGVEIFKNSSKLANFVIDSCKNNSGKINIDGLIIRGPSSISYLAYRIYKMVHIPYIVEMVINPKNFFYERHGIVGTIKGIIGTNIIVNHTKKLCWNANGVCYVTKNVLQKFYPSRSIKRGYSDKFFFDTYALDVMLGDNGFSEKIMAHNNDEPFIMCHTGWMVGENKGHRVVLQILKRLLEDKANCFIKFIGDGPKKSEFQEYAKELRIDNNVIFLGQINGYSELQKELTSSHLFIFPSRIEGLPRAVVEAMANSLPVISFDNDGIPELIDKEFLAHVGDIDRLYKLAKLFYENEEFRTKVAKENYIRAHEYKTEKFDMARKDFFLKFRSFLENYK